MSVLNMTYGVDTYYKEYSCRKWNYWTYSDGLKVQVGEKQVLKAIGQGDKLVVVN